MNENENVLFYRCEILTLLLNVVIFRK